MGYTTKFDGVIELSKSLTKEQQEWFDDWKSLRRCKRDVEKLQEEYKGKGSLNGDYGKNGELFGYIPEKFKSVEEYERWTVGEGYGDWVNGNDIEGSKQFSIDKSDYSPCTSFWCGWKIEGNILSWDGGEKFYDYVEWLEYIRDNILFKLGIEYINSEEGILWSGEEVEDHGMIWVEDNKIIQKYPTYEEEGYY